MVDRGGEFGFFQGFRVRIDIGNDISIFIRPMTQMRLIKQVLVTSLRKDHVTN